MVAEKKKCLSDGFTAGKFDKITGCFNECINRSTMFSFAQSNGSCVCEIGASENGYCTRDDQSEYNLYRIIAEGNHYYL